MEADEESGRLETDVFDIGLVEWNVKYEEEVGNEDLEEEETPEVSAEEAEDKAEDDEDDNEGEEVCATEEVGLE